MKKELNKNTRFHKELLCRIQKLEAASGSDGGGAAVNLIEVAAPTLVAIVDPTAPTPLELAAIEALTDPAVEPGQLITLVGNSVNPSQPQYSWWVVDNGGGTSTVIRNDQVPVSSGRYLYVANDGNNATAVEGDINRPWKDPWAAVAAANADDLVYVFKGVWSSGVAGEEATHGVVAFDHLIAAAGTFEQNSLYKDGVNIYLDPGAVINTYNEDINGQQINAPLFYLDASGEQSILGFGEFSMIGSTAKGYARVGVGGATNHFGSYFVRGVVEDVTFKFEADKLITKDFAFDVNSIDTLTADIKEWQHTGRSIFAERVPNAVNKGSVDINVKNFISKFTEPDEIAGLNVLGPIYQVGGLGMLIRGGNKTINVSIDNAIIEETYNYNMFMSTLVNTDLSLTINNYTSLDSGAIHLTPAAPIADTDTNPMFRLQGWQPAGTLNGEFDESSVNIQIGNARFIKTIFGASLQSSENAKLHLNCDNAILNGTSSVIKYQRDGGDNRKATTGKQTTITVSGDYTAADAPCIITGTQWTIPLEEYCKIIHTGRFQTLGANPVVYLQGNATGNFDLDGGGDVVTPAGKLIFKDATLKGVIGQPAIDADKPFDVILQNVYGNTATTANITEFVDLLAVDPNVQ